MPVLRASGRRHAVAVDLLAVERLEAGDECVDLGRGVDVQLAGVERAVVDEAVVGAEELAGQDAARLK